MWSSSIWILHFPLWKGEQSSWQVALSGSLSGAEVSAWCPGRREEHMQWLGTLMCTGEDSQGPQCTTVVFLRLKSVVLLLFAYKEAYKSPARDCKAGALILTFPRACSRLPFRPSAFLNKLTWNWKPGVILEWALSLPGKALTFGPLVSSFAEVQILLWLELVISWSQG